MEKLLKRNEVGAVTSAGKALAALPADPVSITAPICSSGSREMDTLSRLHRLQTHMCTDIRGMQNINTHKIKIEKHGNEL